MQAVVAALLECALVLCVGLGLGLAVNALSDDGIALGRDYFPELGTPRANGASTTQPDGDGAPPSPRPTGAEASAGATRGVREATADDAATTAAGDPSSATDDEAFAPAHVFARLAEHGLAAMTLAEARATFEDPLYEFGAYVFVDARQDEPFLDGHVPGAYRFDRYRPERDLPEVMPLLATSSRIVVYCNGGECEDSEYAADTLLQFGASRESVFVFVGGIVQWTAAGLPVERGPRGSGDLVPGTSDG